MDTNTNSRSAYQKAARGAQMIKGAVMAGSGIASGNFVAVAQGVAEAISPKVILAIAAIILFFALLPVIVISSIPQMLFSWGEVNDAELIARNRHGTELAQYYEDTVAEQPEGVNPDIYWLISIESVRKKQNLDEISKKDVKASVENSYTIDDETDEVYNKTPDEIMNELGFDEEQKNWASLIENGMKQNGASIKRAVAVSLSSALELANGVKNAVMAWGSGDAQMSKNPLNTEVLKRTAKSAKLIYIANFLGRYTEMLNSKRMAGYTYGRGEKYDIEYGNNISKALTSEIALLSCKELVPLFMKKYQNKTLKQYRKREPEHKVKGDVIVCLDESNSTFGENNAYGMALAMVLYRICKLRNTNFALIHFSSDTKVDYFPKNEEVPAEKILNCAETFLGGGTDFEKPLKEVFNLTENGMTDKPDIVFITDGVCEISDSFASLLDKFKADTGAKLTGILLNSGGCSEFSLQRFADKVYRTSELLKDEIVDDVISERL